MSDIFNSNIRVIDLSYNNLDYPVMLERLLNYLYLCRNN